MIPLAAQTLDRPLSELMTGHPITVTQHATVESAAAVMRACRIRHLPVTDGERLVGVLSIRDLLRADARTAVESAMSRPVEVGSPEMGLSQAVERMLARRISCLPVVDREDRLTGIFTTADGLRTAIAALAEEANQLRAEPTVAQLMTSRPLIVVGPKIALDQAAALIRDGRIRHVPILDGETLVGLLSDRDVLAHPGAERVADAMSTRLSTIAAERPAIEAARILSRRRIGALPVLRAGRLVGIVTSSDFLYWILAHV